MIKCARTRRARRLCKILLDSNALATCRLLGCPFLRSGMDCWAGPGEEKECNASYPVPKDVNVSSSVWGAQVQAYTCCPKDATSENITASVAVKTGLVWKPQEMYVYVGIGLVSKTFHYIVLAFCTGYHRVLIFPSVIFLNVGHPGKSR